MTNPVDVALGPSRQLGAYFGLVSGLSSLIPISFILLLVLSGAPQQRPALDQLEKALGSLGIVDVALLGFATLVVGVATHPLQFGLTQILEGYWGASTLGRRAMVRSASLHMAKWYRLSELLASSNDYIADDDLELTNAADLIRQERSKRWERTASRNADRQATGRRLIHSIDAQEANRILGFYPTSPSEIMPTKLGNTLRRYETQGRDFLGLDPVVALPYVGLLADDKVRAYLDDQRSGMDLSVRLTLMWTICTVVGILFLWRYDLWLFIPLVTYFLSIMAYRGAVRSATLYGSAITVTLTLTKRSLQQRLGLEPPTDTVSEFELNNQITALLSGEPAYLVYHPLAEDTSPVPDLPPEAFLG